jgi:hypothetical protein
MTEESTQTHIIHSFDQPTTTTACLAEMLIDKALLRHLRMRVSIQSSDRGVKSLSCSLCGVKIKKGERFVSVGDYPSWWKIAGARTVGPGYFGKVYHEACYLEVLKKRVREKGEESEESNEKSSQSKEEKASSQSARRRLVR